VAEWGCGAGQASSFVPPSACLHAPVCPEIGKLAISPTTPVLGSSRLIASQRPVPLVASFDRFANGPPDYGHYTSLMSSKITKFVMEQIFMLFGPSVLVSDWVEICRQIVFIPASQGCLVGGKHADLVRTGIESYIRSTHTCKQQTRHKSRQLLQGTRLIHAAGPPCSDFLFWNATFHLRYEAHWRYQLAEARHSGL
jgi:hypothetical protein